MNSESSPRPQPQPFCCHHQQRAVRALRQILRPAVLRDILAGAPGKRATRALRQARRLEPGQTAIAMECHQALIRELRADLRFHGWVNPEWSAVLWHLTLYLEQAGWELVEGRWVVEELAPADREREPSAWELGLSSEALARLSEGLRRRRSKEPPDSQAAH